MNTKQTSEGHIFHCEGDREVAMAHRLLSDGVENSLSSVLAGRLGEGGGAFCVFHSEVEGFVSLMEELERAGCGGGDTLAESLRDFAGEMKVAVSLPQD